MDKTASIFRVQAHNTAAESENKIHDDQVAAQYGFRGGLVPGVTVYSYMVPAILDRFGRTWIQCGSANVRFHAPCYEGETVITRYTQESVTAEREDGSVFASGTASADRELPAQDFPWRPLPEKDQRPAASSQTIISGVPLGTIREILDVQEESAIPLRLLRMANEILVRNFRMSPWIHAGSHLTHHALPALGSEITVTGTIAECFEHKGRRFAVAALAMSEAGKVAACVRHTFIYQL